VASGISKHLMALWAADLVAVATKDLPDDATTLPAASPVD